MIGTMKILKKKEGLAEIMEGGCRKYFSTAGLRQWNSGNIRNTRNYSSMGHKNPALAHIPGCDQNSDDKAGAFLTHPWRKELIPMGIVNIILFSLAVFTAAGRF